MKAASSARQDRIHMLRAHLVYVLVRYARAGVRAAQLAVADQANAPTRLDDAMRRAIIVDEVGRKDAALVDPLFKTSCNHPCERASSPDWPLRQSCVDCEYVTRRDRR